MTRPLRGLLPALLIGAIGAGAAASAATTGGHGKPVVVPAPAHPPKMVRVNGACALPNQTESTIGGNSDADLVWVRAHPIGVVAIWIPGLNSKRCAARRTTGAGGMAGRVAVAIRHARAFPNQPLPCPNDDNTQVRLYFRYADGGDEYVDVTLAGCRSISAPERRSRWSDPAVEKPLRRIAPSAWRSRLDH